MISRDLDMAAISALKEYQQTNINDGHCLVDGIIDVDAYAKSEPRILWVLKESVNYGNYTPLDAWISQRLSEKKRPRAHLSNDGICFSGFT